MLLKLKIIKFFSVLTVCIIGGMFGAWSYDYMVNNYINRMSGPSLNQRSLSQQPVVIRNSKSIVVEQDTKIIDTIYNSDSLLFGLYQKNKTNVYDLTRPAAQGLVLTSDGWMLTNYANSDKNWPSGFVAVDKTGQVFQIDREIVDSASGMKLIHLQKVSGLAVAGFVKSMELRRGQMLLAVNWLSVAMPNNIALTDTKALSIRSSDLPIKELSLINRNLQVNSLVLVDLSGRVAGLINSRGQIISADYFVFMANSLISGKSAVLPVLGVNYINTSWQSRLITDLVGAKLTKSETQAAVIKNSPADKAGLQEGDLIISVDNNVINHEQDLADLISDYQPQDRVAIKYLRAGKEKTVDVQLSGQ